MSSGAAYKVAIEKGPVGDVCKDIPNWRDWTKGELVVKVINYKTKREFKQCSNCAYITAE